MLCCPHCFDDSFLLGHVTKLSRSSGTCSFCKRTAVPVIRPTKLTDDFQAVTAIYAPNEDERAKPLLDWLRNDWGLFSQLETVTANSLLALILEDPQAVVRPVLPIASAQPPTLMKWSTFRDEIMWRNRFFFRQDLDLDRLRDLFQNYLETSADELDHTVYRARLQDGEEPLQLKDMGKPPARSARNGRANPLGIPYLYAASTPETAIAEIRPHPGDHIWVAKFQLQPSLRLLNLRHPKTTISPFQIQETEISSFRPDLAFLCRLEEELSKPILPRVADLEYLPTQYLCEFIKNCGYDGVIFKSSISEGVNVTLFNDDQVEPLRMDAYKVTELHYLHEQVE